MEKLQDKLQSLQKRFDEFDERHEETRKLLELGIKSHRENLETVKSEIKSKLDDNTRDNTRVVNDLLKKIVEAINGNTSENLEESDNNGSGEDDSDNNGSSSSSSSDDDASGEVETTKTKSKSTQISQTPKTSTQPQSAKKELNSRPTQTPKSKKGESKSTLKSKSSSYSSLSEPSGIHNISNISGNSPTTSRSLHKRGKSVAFLNTESQKHETEHKKIKYNDDDDGFPDRLDHIDVEQEIKDDMTIDYLIQIVAKKCRLRVATVKEDFSELSNQRIFNVENLRLLMKNPKLWDKINLPLLEKLVLQQLFNMNDE